MSNVNDVTHGGFPNAVARPSNPKIKQFEARLDAGEAPPKCLSTREISTATSPSSIDWWTKVRTMGSTLHELNLLIASPFFAWLFDFVLRVIFGASVLALVVCVMTVGLLASFAIKTSTHGEEVRIAALKRFQRQVFSFLHASVMDLCEWIYGQKLNEADGEEETPTLTLTAHPPSAYSNAVFDPNRFRLKINKAKPLSLTASSLSGVDLKFEEGFDLQPPPRRDEPKTGSRRPTPDEFTPAGLKLADVSGSSTGTKLTPRAGFCISDSGQQQLGK